MDSSPAGSSGTGTGSTANVYSPQGQPTADFNWWQTIQPLINSAGGTPGAPATPGAAAINADTVLATAGFPAAGSGSVITITPTAVVSGEVTVGYAQGGNTYLAATAFANYGYYEVFPGLWRNLTHGAADGAYGVSGGVYSRSFGGGAVLAIVNTGSTAVAYPLSGTYHRLNGLLPDPAPGSPGYITLSPYPYGSLVLISGGPAYGSVASVCVNPGC